MTLAQKVARERNRKAETALIFAEAHGLQTPNGARLAQEASLWREAAQRARLGDLTPIQIHH